MLILVYLVIMVLPHTTVGAQELSWRDVIAFTVAKHPHTVALVQAQTVATFNQNQLDRDLKPQLILSVRQPLAYDSQEPFINLTDMRKGEAKLSSSIDTKYGLSAAASITHHWTLTSEPAVTNFTLACDMALGPKELLYNDTRRDIMAAQDSVQKAAWYKAAEINAIVISTLADLWELELTGQRLEILREALQEAELAFGVLQEQYQLGLVSDTELLSAHLAYLEAEAQVHQDETNRKALQRNLATNMGFEQLPTIAPSGGAQQSDLTRSYKSKALQIAAQANSIAARNHRLDLEMAEFELQRAKLAKYPDVFLSAQYQVPDVTRFQQVAHPWGIMLNIQLPLIDGGQRTLTLQNQQSLVADLTATLQHDFSAAVNLIESALSRWEQACRQTEIASLKLQLAQLEEQAQATDFNQGRLSETAYKQARRKTRLAQITQQAAMNKQRLIELEISSIIGEELRVNGVWLLP